MPLPGGPGAVPSSVFTSAERPVIRIEGGSCQGGFGPRASGAASVWK